MNASGQRATLQRIARRAMMERGLLPDFSRAAIAELDQIRATAAGVGGSIGNLGIGLASFGGTDAGKTAHYLLRWVNPTGEKGPWSETATATIGA
jgi:hypothetical protein